MFLVMMTQPFYIQYILLLLQYTRFRIDGLSDGKHSTSLFNRCLVPARCA